ncbi:hypothetical protein QTG54_007934 [Skeletonema marinoi]|uniref:RING-type domain-containing protein n=1 Tax=Skeletonema marinoi TaxID=267567 RepID=A0AAD8Y7Y3_9STRA|nr:hypothetical protein QTG54_007934 [Skeletonema marinoi]
MSDRPKRPKATAPSAITRSKRSRIDRGECGDGVSCSCCRKDINVNADHVVLKPCMCVICTRCLSNEHAKRGSRALCCPLCDKKATSHRYYSSRTPDDEDILSTECPYEGEPTADDIRQNLPKKYLEQQEGMEGFKRLAEGESIAVLDAFRLKKVGEKVEKLTCAETLSQHIETEDEMESYCSKVGRFMAFLHELIAQPSIIQKNDVPSLRPADIVDYCVDRNSQSPLLSSLFGLATGKHCPDVDKITLEDGDHISHQSQFLAVSLAEGMLLRSISRYPGVFQRMLFEQLSMEGISQPCLNLLSALRIVPSRNYASKTKSKELIEEWIQETTQLDPLDLFMANQDNLGMQQKSKQALNFQFTVFQDIVIPKSTLFDLGIYGENRLSRKKTSWAELCYDDADNNTLAQNIIGVCDKAKQYHSEFIMEDIRATILLCMSGDIPGKKGASIPRLGRIVSTDVNSELSSRSQTVVHTPSSDGAIRALPIPSESDRVIGSGSMYKNKCANITLFAIGESIQRINDPDDC